MEIKINVEMNNNSYASRCDVLSGVKGVQKKHNGGKIVIVRCDDKLRDVVVASLRDDYKVKSFFVAEVE
jgi:hypothetical protein